MTRFLLRRAAASLLLLWAVVTLTFFLVHAAPGSPAQSLVGQLQVLGDVEQLRKLEQVYGLDRPLPQQYLTWLGNVLQGDWGVSMVQGRPALTILWEALPATLLLGLAATVVEYSVALPVGVWAARYRGSPGDHAVRWGALVLYSVPAFWLGIMAILVFASLWPVFPASNMYSPGAASLPPLERALDLAHHLVLPACVVGLTAAGGTLRFVRNSMLDVLGEDYVRTARAKGLGEGRVVRVHALRNALTPLLQLLGLSLPSLLNGVLVVEVVFGWPGIGRIAYNAITTQDLPLLLATTTLAAVLVILGNLAADLAQAASDPRLRRA